MDGDNINPYHEIITNKIEENIIRTQMEQWSILGNIVNYVQYDRHPRNFYDLDVNNIDQKSHRKIYDKFKEEDRQILELQYSRKIKTRLLRYVWRNSVRSDKYY